METSPSSLLHYWKDGNTSVDVNLDPPRPEESKPFHVVIRNRGVIPLSYLVFARDKEHASSRILKSLKKCAKLSKSSCGPHRAVDLLKSLADGTMELSVEPLDTGMICAEVNWASNGGL